MKHRILDPILWIFLILSATGCGRKEKAVLSQKEEMIRILQGQVETLRAEIADLQDALAAEKEMVVQLAEAVRRADDVPGIAPPFAETAEPNKIMAIKTAGQENQDLKPPRNRNTALGEAIRKTIEKKTDAELEETQDREAAFLHEENRRLRAELESLKALMAKGQTAMADIPAEPAPVFRNEQVRATYQAFSASTSAPERIEILYSLFEYAHNRDTDILPVLRRALADPDPEVGRTAAEMLESYQSPEVLPIVVEALQSRDERIRLAALSPLGQVNDPQVAEVMAHVFNDLSEEVRIQGMGIIAQQPEDIQLLSLAKAMESSYRDVKSEGLSLLQLRAEKAVIDVILPGLNDPDPQFRQEVQSILSFLLNQEFTSYQEALRWWKSNRDRFDENLFEQ